MSPGLGSPQDLAQFFGDLLWRIAAQGGGGQVLGCLPIFTMQRQSGGAAVEYGACWLTFGVGREQTGSLGLAVEGATERLSRCFTVTLPSQEECLVGGLHGQSMEFAEVLHRRITFARGALNSTTIA